MAHLHIHKHKRRIQDSPDVKGCNRQIALVNSRHLSVADPGFPPGGGASSERSQNIPFNLTYTQLARYSTVPEVNHPRDTKQ